MSLESRTDRKILAIGRSYSSYLIENDDMRLLICQSGKCYSTLLASRQHHHGLDGIGILDLELSQKRTHLLVVRILEFCQHVFCGGQMKIERVGGMLRKVSEAQISVSRYRAAARCQFVHDQI